MGFDMKKMYFQILPDPEGFHAELYLHSQWVCHAITRGSKELARLDVEALARHLGVEPVIVGEKAAAKEE